MCAGAAAVLALFLLSPACSAGQYTMQVARIGLVAPLTGPETGEGNRWVAATRAAVADWNRAAAGTPYRVELIVYDEAEGPVVARRLAVDPAMLGVAGYRAPPPPEALAALQEAGLPLLTLGPGAAEQQVTEAVTRLLGALEQAMAGPPGERRARMLAALRRSGGGQAPALRSVPVTAYPP